MMHRLGSTSDQLGVGEGVNDMTPQGKAVNVSAKFFLSFTETREQAFRIIQMKHLQ